MGSDTLSISSHFAGLHDPRKYNIRHELLDMVTIAVCAVVCGAETWTQIQEFGRSKIEWLRQFLQLTNGIPSHDTFGRVFSMLDSEQFNESFTNWVRAISGLTNGAIVAIDGKSLRGSHDNDLSAIHMVSAWAAGNGMVLGQVRTDEKSNEITAIPELIRSLELDGAVVTIDAMGTQKTIAKQITDKKADYVLSLKANQPNMHDQVELFFQDQLDSLDGNTAFDYFESVDGDHGRVEVRKYWTTSHVDWLQGREKWSELKTVTMVQRERHIDDNVSIETSYYISSLDCGAQTMAESIRGHWGIENSLHWVLDVCFREDLCRVRKKNGPENLARLRHIALNLLKQEKTLKAGIQTKRLKAAWDRNYLMKVINAG